MQKSLEIRIEFRGFLLWLQSYKTNCQFGLFISHSSYASYLLLIRRVQQ